MRYEQATTDRHRLALEALDDLGGWSALDHHNDVGALAAGEVAEISGLHHRDVAAEGGAAGEALEVTAGDRVEVEAAEGAEACALEAEGAAAGAGEEVEDGRGHRKLLTRSTSALSMGYVPGTAADDHERSSAGSVGSWTVCQPMRPSSDSLQTQSEYSR